MKCRQKQEKSKFQKSTQRSMLKNGGKKLVRGVKTFDSENMNLQLYFAQNIMKKYLKLATMGRNEI